MNKTMLKTLMSGCFGLEKESLRVMADTGRLAVTPHHLTNRYCKTALALSLDHAFCILGSSISNDRSAPYCPENEKRA